MKQATTTADGQQQKHEAAAARDASEVLAEALVVVVRHELSHRARRTLALRDVAAVSGCAKFVKQAFDSCGFWLAQMHDAWGAVVKTSPQPPDTNWKTLFFQTEREFELLCSSLAAPFHTVVPSRYCFACVPLDSIPLLPKCESDCRTCLKYASVVPGRPVVNAADRRCYVADSLMEHLTEFVEKPVDGGLYFAVGEHCYKCNGPPQDEDDILVSEDNWPVPYWSAMSVAALRQELRRVLLQDEFGLACLNNRDPERPSQADNDKLTSQLNIFVDNLSRAAKMCGTSFLWVAHNR
eukprot:TRINITY_DN5644_c0_g1_i1.p2 TRINITY_DN5644_c0_g1~~TRINITY_DN5644_c0_g1_i1.p2  ORF type:complete len:295 (+),score=77.15 TRINITY_DN5644_c0_g1_i1:68-952(+)